jgi:hypothetical protein
MQGLNLADKRRKEILTRAPETPLDRIKEIDKSHFEIQSARSGKTYQVNLLTYTCTCLDFPRIQLCKHIAATVHFFGGGLERPEHGPRAPVNTSEPDVPKSPAQTDGGANSRASRFKSISNEIFRLSLEILEMAPGDPDPEMVKSLKMVQSQLNAVRLSMNDSDNGSRLPEKEKVGPNQLSWPPTAACMGVKRGKKRQGKADSALTAEHIGVPKRKRTNDDPYGAGEDSGKRAKPDAVSAAANARARAAEERKALKAADPPPLECPPPPASLPTRLPPGPASYAQLHPMHAPAVYSPAHFPLPSVPYSQPTYAFQYPVSQPAPYYPPMFSTYTFPPSA